MAGDGIETDVEMMASFNEAVEGVSANVDQMLGLGSRMPTAKVTQARTSSMGK